MAVNKPTTILDKSVVHSICKLEGADRARLWSEISARFDLIIPRVLVEEVWINFGQPGNKDPIVVRAMVDKLKELAPKWIEEELNLIFDELVVAKATPSNFKTPEPRTVDLILRLSPGHSEFEQFLTQRERYREEEVGKRLVVQNEFKADFASDGLTIKVPSEQELFEVVKTRFNDILDNQPYRLARLDKLFGKTLGERNPGWTKRIRRGIRNFNRHSYSRFKITSALILAKLVYIYGPILRVEDGTGTGRAILRSKKSAQIGNQGDERYVASALMCQALITRDEEMAKVMHWFIDAKLWDGRVVYLPPQADIRSLIPGSL